MTALPRRGYLGVLPAPSPRGVVVSALAEGGPGARAGLERGDVVLAIDGVEVEDVAAFRGRLARLCGGDIVTLTVARDGVERVVEVAADARPVERYDGLAVRLGEARHGMVRLRTIAVSPEGAGPWPCVYYLQGYSCGSVERPEGAPARDALRGFVEAVARAGYCVWRTEKRAVGDSEGPPCADASFEDERGDFAAGLEAIFDDPYVDASEVFLLGHSLGAMHAPALATDHVRAMALHGGGTHPWVEYLGENARRWCERAGSSQEDTERRVRVVERFARAVLVEGRSVEEVLAQDPEIAERRASLGVDAHGRIHGRSVDYWRAVQREDVTGALAATRVPVLAMWGSADWLSTREEHEEIARLTGGSFVEVEGADHGFFARATEAESYAAGDAGSFQGAVAEVLVRWMRRQRRESVGVLILGG